MTRAILSSILVFIRTVTAVAQGNATVSFERMKVAYVGVHNDLKVVAEKIPCRDLWLKTDNGRIVRTDNCNFDFVPAYAATSTIYVCKIIGRDTVKFAEIFPVSVREYSEPKASVRGKYMFADMQPVAGSERQYLSQTLSANSIPTLERLATFIEGFDFDVEGAYPINHFTLTVLSSNRGCRRVSSNNSAFTKEVQEILRTAKSGDTVLFTDVTAIYKGNTVRLRPLELNIK